MQWIHNWRDLEAFGIDLLTGEACAYNYRFLCDVTASGQRVLEQLWDTSLTLHPPWNSGRKDDPHVGSIMLAQPMFASIAAFALLQTSCERIWILKSGAVAGLTSAEDAEHRPSVQDDLAQVLFNRGFSRHTHQFSGRTT